MQTHAEFLRLLVVLLPFVLVIGGLGIGLILYYLRQYRLMKLLRNKYLDDLEKERQRISMELHDLYGPFSMQIRTRLATLGKDEGSKVQAIDALIDKLSNELRLKNQELYPMRILDEPFDHSLSYLVEILSNRKCEVAMNYEIRSVVPERIRIHLYRVIQELLLNAIKHVAPPYIQIEATEGPGWIELSLYYPNPGEKELKIKRSRRGQSIIGERLRYINGTRSYELSEQMTLETITVKL